MFRTKLTSITLSAVLGMALVGGSIASAHEGHEHWGGAEQAVKADAVNEAQLCPVSGEKISPKDLKSAYKYEYKGKTYYLCCADCLAKFVDHPEKYISK